ncbi:putative oxidoreductase YcjS (plasmid) [Labrenzia sp. THAF191b]|nr:MULTISPECIES: Gfo/Idh/MocA family oxidoreductase [unclassified Labrenzia]QFT01661.1 putative oxidoreductase YcjS [Labrenzia sp. THAF191b]QFT07866.1 putative oxidoreductase YcjS [Labrenzia sp. THAF191a]QFT19268.1 putative oxidoreductase YcjS [Labrenzia sp. THAF187b]
MSKTPLRVGIVGTGRISDLHAIEYTQNPRGRITALCDRDPALARSRAAAWGCTDAAIEEDYEALLARDDVDLVELLLPHHLHLSAALKAIEAGKIVSLQKPMCMNLAEADQLVAAAEAHDRPFKIFENFIFHPPVMKAKELIGQGAIGEPLSIRIKSNPGKSKTAWEVPKEADAWRQQLEMAGGGPLVFDDGHHKFALAWHFMGMPSEVHAFIHHTERPDGGLFDAPSIISFRFPGNRIGNLEIVYSPELEIAGKYYAQDDRVEITGTHGVLWINCGHGSIGNSAPLVHFRDGKVTEYTDIPSGWEQSFIHSTRHFLHVLHEGGDPVLTARQGRSVLRFALAAEQSAREGRTVSLGGDV